MGKVELLTTFEQIKLLSDARRLAILRLLMAHPATLTHLGRALDQHRAWVHHHPMTQSKIERFHRSMKNLVKLQNFYYPWELEREIASFVDYYNNQRYNEWLDNLTPADVYYGREKEVLARREDIKR